MRMVIEFTVKRFIQKRREGVNESSKVTVGS